MLRNLMIRKLSRALALTLIAALTLPPLGWLTEGMAQAVGTAGGDTSSPVVQLGPSNDTYVRGGANAAANFGTSAELAIKTSTAGLTRQALLQFDLGSYSGTVGAAKLMVFGGVSDSEGSEVDVQAYGLDGDDWSEGTLTWNNRPEPEHYLDSTLINKTKQWHAFDVTAFVKRQIESDGKATFMLLEEANPGLFVMLHSKENTVNTPYIELSPARLQEAAPAWPTGSRIEASWTGSDSAALNWTAATEPTGVSEYTIYQNGRVAGSVYGHTQTFTVHDLTPGSRNTFKVEARNADGYQSADGPYVTYEAKGQGLEAEAETFAAASFSPILAQGAVYSSGRYLSLFTDTDAPEDGYWVQYLIHAPTAGAYDLEVTASPPQAAWASPYDIKVNNGPFVRVTQATEINRITETVRQYRLKPVMLEAGPNMLGFRVTERRSQPDTRYTFFLDAFRLVFAYPTDYEGEAAAATNFTPGIEAGSAYSGGRQLALLTDAAPENGYWAEYEVEVPHAGLYQLDVAATLPNVSGSSPYQLSVNGSAFRTVTEAASYGTVSGSVYRYHLSTVSLQAGTNTVAFRIMERREQPDTRYAFSLDWLRLIPSEMSIRSLTASAPMNVFQSGQESSFLVQVDNRTGLAARVAYSILDYWDTEFLAQTVTLPPDQHSFTISLNGLPKGHYRITAQIEGGEKSLSELFAIVTALDDRPQVDDSPFGIDAALAWIMLRSKLGETASVLKLTGATWIRDRLRWNDAVHPEPGVYRFNADAAEASIAALYSNGFQISDVYHSAPSWTKSSASDKLPDQLLAAYEWAKQSAAAYGEQVKTWELWNEPDITHFANPDETADKYAAFLKAAAIGYRDSGAEPHIAISGFALLPGVFEQVMMENEVLPYFDIYNIHRHQRHKPGEANMPYPDGVETHKQFLESYGGGSKPLWVTEAGISFGITAPTELTHVQQAVQARYIVTSTVTSIAQGTDKHFAFLALPLQEGAYYWGMLSRAFTPYAAYAAEAAMTEALGRGDYIGSVNGLPAQTTGHAFRDGADSVLVLWSSEPKQVSLTLGALQAVHTDIMGRSTPLAADSGGTYTIATGLDPIYIRVPGAFPPSLVEDNGRTITRPAPYTLSSEERIVLAQRYAAATRAESKELGYNLAHEGPNTIQVDIYNLNPMPMSGTLIGSAEGGWVIEEPVQTVTVAAYSKATVEFAIRAGSAVTIHAVSPVSFQMSFDDARTTKSVAYVRTTADYPTSELLPNSDNPTAWRLDLPNAIAAIGTGAVTAGAETGSVQFKYDFGTGDKWAYPFLLMPEKIDYSEYPGLTFELYADRDIANTTLRLFVREQSGARYITSAGFTIRQGWNRIRAPFELFSRFDGVDANGKLDTHEIVSVQLGINTSLSDVPAFVVRQFGVYSRYLDLTPPATTAVVSQEPDGEDDAYTQPVTVTLEASDNKPGPILTLYSLDQGATWTVYSAPLVFDASGFYELLYRSSDGAGNAEPEHRLLLLLDL